MLISQYHESLCLGFAVGLIATVYRIILSREKILFWWFRFGNNFEKSWFFPIIWGCEKCIAGQLTAWIYLFTHIAVIKKGLIGTEVPFPAIILEFRGYSLLQHIFSVSAAIFTAVALTQILTIWKKQN